MKKGLTISVLIVTAIAATSLLLFLKQGGFGGGHGDFDKPIFILGLPWTAVPWPWFVIKRDIIWLTGLPFILNFLSVFLIWAGLRIVRRRKSEI